MAGAIALGAHTLPYRAYAFERALEGIVRAGYRSTGIWNDHAGTQVVPPDASSAHIAGVRRQVEAAGLAIHMVFRFPSATQGDVAQLRRTVEVAAELGCPFALTTGPSPYVRAFTERKRDMLFLRQAMDYIHLLRAVARDAERAGVTLVAKPHMGVTGTGEDLADLVEMVGSPALKICYDAGNIAFYEGLKPEDDLKTCVRHVAALCIKDHRGARFNADFPIPGEGEVDHESLFGTLLGAGFAGPCLVERIDGQPTAEAIDAALAQARQHMEQAISAAGG